MLSRLPMTINLGVALPGSLQQFVEAAAAYKTSAGRESTPRSGAIGLRKKQIIPRLVLRMDLKIESSGILEKKESESGGVTGDARGRKIQGLFSKQVEPALERDGRPRHMRQCRETASLVITE